MNIVVVVVVVVIDCLDCPSNHTHHHCTAQKLKQLILILLLSANDSVKERLEQKIDRDTIN